MITGLYKYVAFAAGGLVIVAALCFGSYLRGAHTQKKADAGALATTVANLNQRASSVLQAALAKQAAHDAAREKASQEALQALTEQVALQAKRAKDFQTKLEVLENVEANRQWLTEPVPAAVRSLLNGSAQASGNQGNNGYPDPVRAYTSIAYCAMPRG